MKRRSIIEDGTVEVDATAITTDGRSVEIEDAKAAIKDKQKDITEEKIREVNGQNTREEKEIQE